MSWRPRPDLSRLLAVGVLAATGASMCGTMDWRLALLSNFRLHLLALCVPLTALLSGRRDWMPTAAVGAALALNLADVALQHARTRAAGRIGDGGGPADLRVAVFNLKIWNRTKTRAIDWLASQDADAIVLVEVTRDWLGPLRRLDGAFSYRETMDGGLPGMIRIVSRHPLRRLFATVVAQEVLLGVEVAAPGRPFALVGVHAFAPLSADGLAAQRAYLDAAARHARRIDMPVVVAGDFNASPWSPMFRRFRDRSGLAAPIIRAGTLPSRMGVLGVPVDHVFAGRGLRVIGIRTGPHLGSDHRPVTAALRAGA